jgi:hypothetical protein
MTLPLLALALERPPSAPLTPLLAAMFRWCVPAASDPAAGEPAAVLATVCSAGRVPEGRPLAVWTQSVEEARSEAAARAAAIVSDAPSVVAVAGDRGVLAPPSDHAQGRRPVSPFVRERLRRARGLPEVAVLEQADDGWRWPELPDPLPDDLIETAMACASAVVVGEPGWLLAVLAWGAPCVSDPDAAVRVGAVAGTHLLVGRAPEERLRLAGRLALDPGLASRLGWAGRRLVESRHDPARSAMRLAELLGLRPSLPEGATASARLQLALLGVPSDARIAGRLAAATAGLAEKVR